MLGLLIALSAPSVYGANTQGLHWGLNEGDRLDYRFVVHSSYTTMVPFTSIDEGFYFIADDLPLIPDTVVTATNLYKTFQAYWSNGSMISSSSGLPNLVTVFVVGNWSLVNSLVFPAMPSLYRIVDSELLWGIEGNQPGPEVGQTNNMSMTFLKSDGALYKVHQTIYDWFADEDVFEYEITRVTEKSGGYGFLTLIAVASIAVEIVIALVLIKKHRQ